MLYLIRRYLNSNTLAPKYFPTGLANWNTVPQSGDQILPLTTLGWNVCKKDFFDIQRTYSSGIAKEKRSYTDRRSHFERVSLERRRRMIDSIFLYEIFLGKVDYHQSLGRFMFRLPARYPRTIIPSVILLLSSTLHYVEQNLQPTVVS